MSFRLFVYASALCGAWAALAAWALGRFFPAHHPLASAGLKALYLGSLLALALAVVDALWSYSLRQARQIVPRVATSAIGGALAGLAGGMAGQYLYDVLARPVFFVLGWGITGLLVGTSLVLYDLLARFVRRRGMQGGLRKALQAIGGGTAGGLLGGFLSLQLRHAAAALFPHAEVEDLWGPSALGFVVLGLAIGLMIGLAQVLFKESWVRFEAGRRRGREMILTRPVLVIGRAEGCDIGLFGEQGVDRAHARLERRGDGYVVCDAGSAAGTFVNGRRISEPTPLRSGDAIGVGAAVLRFVERHKR